jgi:hypothetical protein
MSRLYIANPTKQTQVICYRLDFDKDGQQIEANKKNFQPARQQDIPPGQQRQLGSDFHITQINDIVDQLAKYGLIGEVDVPRLRAADFDSLRGGVVPYIFNIDRAVSKNVMLKVQAHNDSLLVQDGVDRRKKAAVASSEIVQQAVAHQFAEMGIDEKPTDRFAVAFEQEEQSEAGEKTIAEGYRVGPQGEQPPPARGKGKNRRK